MVDRVEWTQNSCVSTIFCEVFVNTRTEAAFAFSYSEKYKVDHLGVYNFLYVHAGIRTGSWAILAKIIDRGFESRREHIKSCIRWDDPPCTFFFKEVATVASSLHLNEK